MKIITTENASASQTEHPWRATVRTLIQSALGAGVTILGILVLVPGAMEELSSALGELGIVVPAALIALPPVIARIMAIPGVEKALRGIGLGAAPTDPRFGTWEGESDEAEVDDLDSPDADPTLEPDEEAEVVDEADEPALLDLDLEPTIPDEEDAVAEDLDGDSLEQAAREEHDETPPPEGYEPRH